MRSSPARSSPPTAGSCWRSDASRLSRDPVLSRALLAELPATVAVLLDVGEFAASTPRLRRTQREVGSLLEPAQLDDEGLTSLRVAE